MKMWIARGREEDAGLYYLDPSVKLRNVSDDGWDLTYWFGGGNEHMIKARYWHRIGGLRLKPGEGPVRVDMTVTVKKA